MKKNKKKRLRRKFPRWPRAICSGCGQIIWRGDVVTYFFTVEHSPKCNGFFWMVPNMTTGFALAKLKWMNRARFAQIQLIGEKCE